MHKTEETGDTRTKLHPRLPLPPSFPRRLPALLIACVLLTGCTGKADGLKASTEAMVEEVHRLLPEEDTTPASSEKTARQ